LPQFVSIQLAVSPDRSKTQYGSETLTTARQSLDIRPIERSVYRFLQGAGFALWRERRGELAGGHRAQGLLLVTEQLGLPTLQALGF
jgi:hypothetical protein